MNWLKSYFLAKLLDWLMPLVFSGLRACWEWVPPELWSWFGLGLLGLLVCMGVSFLSWLDQDGAQESEKFSSEHHPRRIPHPYSQ